MKRNAWYPSRVADQVICLVNLINKLPTYATTLGLTTGQVTAALADCRWLVYVFESWLPAARAWGLACTDAAAEAQTGDGTELMALPVFTPPTPPTGVVPVNTGALNRIFVLVQLIKEGGKCTAAIASDLGIVGPEVIAPDLNTVQPSFKAAQTAEGVFLNWGWGNLRDFLDLIELQVDRGDGQGWKPLAFDTTPGYTDTTPPPATPAKWKYRGIYHVEDHQVGLWSTEASINLGG